MTIKPKISAPGTDMHRPCACPEDMLARANQERRRHYFVLKIFSASRRIGTAGKFEARNLTKQEIPALGA
jgi:hypothetical protein